MPRFVGNLWKCLVLAAVYAVWVGIPIARGQPAPEPPKPVEKSGEKPADKPPAESDPGGPVREAKPETFYLIDKDGKLVPYFDIPFEEFRRLYLLDRKLKAPDQPPRYSLQQLIATGSVEGNQASLDLAFKIQLNESGWTRVPLRFNNAVLARDEGPKDDLSKQFIEFDKGTDGYVAWLQGEKGTGHSLKLKFLLPVEQIAGDSRLLLQIPRTSGAELQLKVPTANAVTDAVEGVISQPSRKLPDGYTELRLLGLAGDVPLVWREAREQLAKTPAVLEASGVTLLRFQGQSHISGEARLKVRGLNGPIDSFQVRLPVGMKLIPISQARYVATAIEPKQPVKKPPAGSPPDAQLVDIKLLARTSEPVDITLLAEMTRASADMLWEAAGFEVLGAIGQWGHVDLAVEGDWSLNWVEGSNVQRVPEPADAAARQNVVARFEYSRQPHSLKVQVLPKRTRISVEPSYVVQVEAQQVRLEARLKYKVRGAKAYSVDIDMSGWKIDPNGFTPANLVQLDALSVEETSPLKIPLSPLAQTAGGEFELQVAAYRDAKPGEKLSFSLPRPQAGAISPAAVVILPADNVELSPTAADLQGLAPETLPPSIKLPPRQQTPLFYRDRSENGPAQFAGQFKVRKGTTSVSATGRVHFDDRTVQVEQRLLYRIAFEPLKELVVDVPRGLFLAESLTFTLDGEPLAAAALADEGDEDESGPSTRQRVRLDLRGERIGPYEVRVAYTLPLPTAEAGKEVNVVTPLVVPTAGNETTLTRNSLTVTNTNAVRIEQGDGPWASEDSATVPAGEEQKLFAPAETSEVVFVATHLQPQKRGTTSVAQAWLQTWLTARDRRDRATLRLTTSDDQVRIQLPSGVRTSDLEAAVNGRQVVEPRVDGEGRVEIKLPEGDTPREFVVELWYSFDAGRPPRGGFAGKVPQVVGSPWISRFYWQLVVPRNEHLVWAPPGMTPELSWNWQGLGWGRQSTLDQADLENWIGASQQAPLPEAVNQYLYSSFGAVERVEAWTASRALILFAVSGAVLLAGFLLIYFPVLRHPAVLLLAAVAVSAGALFEPEPALQLGQVAAVGLALALMSRVMHWMLTRRRESRAIIHGSSLGLDSNVESRPSRREGNARPSTATAQLTIPVPAGEARL